MKANHIDIESSNLSYIIFPQVLKVKLVQNVELWESGAIFIILHVPQIGLCQLCCNNVPLSPPSGPSALRWAPKIK